MRRAFLLGAALALLMSASAFADIKTFNIVMSGSQEVPPNASPGTGTGTAIFDDITGAISISGTFSGLLDSATAGHLHGYAAAGSNAGVIFPFSVLTNATSGVFSGAGVIPSARIADVLNGLTYLNIHDATFPGGEIRGQLINPVPEPGTIGLLAAGAAAIGFYRWRRRR